MPDNVLDFGAAARSLTLESDEQRETEKPDFGAAARSLVEDSAGANLKATSKVDPDRFARALGLSKKSGLPLPAVDGNEDYVERELGGVEGRRALRDARKTSHFLANPENAKVAHDDVPQLVEVEKRLGAVRGRGKSYDLPLPNVGNVVRGVGERAFDLVGGMTRFVGEVADTISDPMDRYLGVIEYDFTGSTPKLIWRRATEDEVAEPSPLERFAKDFEDVSLGYKPGTSWEDVKERPLMNFLPFALEQGIVSAPDMVAVLRNLPAYVVSRTGEIGQERAQNDGRVSATVGDFIAAAPATIVSALLERLGARGILGIDDALKGTGKRAVAAATARGTVKEGATEFLQEGIESTASTLGTERGFDAAETLDQAFAGAVGGIGFGGTVRGVTATAENIVKSRQAIQNRDAMDKAHEAAVASRLNERMPEKAAEHSGAVLREQGVDNVSIPVAAVEQYFQSDSGVDPAKFLGDIGVTEEQYQEAVARGGDIDMTPEAYAQHIYGTDKYMTFRDHIRLGDDAMTAAETQEFMESGLAAEFEAMGDGAEADAARADVDQIQSEIEAQLVAAGEAPSTARLEATLLAQRYAVRGLRAGVAPLEMWQRDNVRIQAGDPAQPVDELTVLLDKARSTDPDKFLGLSKTPALDMLRDEGVDPDGALAGELRAMGVTNKTHPGLFKRGGRTAADNFVASETGGLFDTTGDGAYVPEADILAAISEELAGAPRRSPDQQAELELLTGDVDNLVSQLGAAGLTLESSDAEIRAALEGRTFEQEAAALSETKVVDESGAPLLVYHGTNSSFDQFGDALTFFSDQETAQDYADEFEGVKGEDGPRVVASYLDIRNPASDADVLRVAGIPEGERDINFAPEYLDNPAVVDALKAEGFDGIILDGDASPSRPGEMVRSYAVFGSGQIIRPDANRGTFDPNDARILFQKAAPGAPSENATEPSAGDIPFDGRAGDVLARTGDIEGFREINEAAQKIVLDDGARDGVEHMIIVNSETGDLVVAGTIGHLGKVDVPQRFFDNIFSPDGGRNIVHHNHPNDSAISRADLEMSSAPALDMVFAYGHDGSITAAGLTPEATAAGVNHIGIRAAHQYADAALRRVWQPFINSGEFNLAEANAAHQDAINRALAGVGLIEYYSSFKEIDAPYYGESIAAAEEAAKNGLEKHAPGFVPSRLHRPTVPIRADGGVGVVLERSRAIATARPSVRPGGQGSQKNAGGTPEVDSDGQFRLLESAAPLQSNRLDVQGSGPGGRVTNWDFAEALTERHMEKYGRALDPADPADYEIIVNEMFDEYQNQLKEHDTGHGWYVEDIAKAIEITTDIIPELADPLNRDLFLTIAALTSPQQKPRDNWQNAIWAMQGFVESGKIALRRPNGKQFGVQSHTTGLQLMQHLIDKYGLEGAVAWVREPHTGREIAEERKASGIFVPKDKINEYLASETNLTEYYPGIAMMGPKVGEFMQNATGFDQEAVTVDLWMARTYNRLIGRLTDVSAKERAEKKIAGQLRGKGEREHIKRIVRDIAGKAEIDPSAMQAALWYFEQRLYRNHGIKSDSQNFSGAAQTAAEKLGLTPRGSEGAQGVGGTAAQSVVEILRGFGHEGRRLDQPNRGSIRFGNETVITLGANSDRSTFLHESGHLFLEQLAQDAREFGSEQLVTDWNTVREWWASNAASIKREAIDYAKQANDTEAVETLTAMSEADVARGAKMGDLSDPYVGRAMHEQWARGTEDYFRTGQAPSVALQDAFNRFRAWLVSIYSALKRRMGAEQLDVVFSPEVKDVMDRLLASDEDIELVKQQYDLKALFGSAEEMGMTPKQFEAYQRTVARQAEDAKTRQLKKYLRESEREQREWWKEESEKAADEVADDVGQRPVYRALYALTRGTMPNGEPAPIDHGRLDKKAVVAILENTKSLARLPKVRGAAVYTTKKGESGTHPDIIAQMYGYEDGRAMLMDLMASRPMADVVAEETDAIMKDRHGDMLNDGSAVEKAIESAHTDKRGEVLAMELNALRDSQDKMKPAFIRAWAKERIGTRKVDDIQPQKFLAIERKKGREAGKLFREGDRLGAQRAKFQQLLNFYMAQEAYKVRNEVAKQRKYLDGFTKPKATFKSIDADYIDQIRGILENYSLAPRLSDAKRATLEEWVKQKEEEGAIFDIPARLLADQQTHYRDLTLDEFRTLVDTIKNIEAQGRNAKSALIEGEEVAINEMSDDIIERLEDRPQNKRVARMAKDQNPGDLDKFVGKLASFDASLRKVEFLLADIDGEANGPAHRYIFQVFADAEAKKNDITKSVTRAIMNGMGDLKNLGEKFTVGQQDRTYRRSDLIMMALNVGNESNYQKMIEGSQKDVVDGSIPLNEAIVDEALSHLTEADWNFVQSVWDAIESMYPQVDEIYRRENGVSPEKIEPREITTRWGQTLRGGYFPMMYDPERSTQARDIEGKSALEAMQSNAVKASVYSGMTKARTGFSAPVLLDLEKLPMHIEKTAHYVTHYEPVRLTRKLISRRDVVSAITNKLGREKYDTIKNWIGDLAANGQPVAPRDTIGKFVESMRANATIAIMGFSYTTMMSQTLGYSQSIDILSKTEDGGYNPIQGAKWVSVGIAEYMKNPADAKRKVFEMSGEMRHRLENTDRDIRHALGRLTSKKKNAWRNFQRFSLMGIAGVQLYTVDFPTWLGAYNRALSRGATQQEAVNAADSVLRMSQTAGGMKDLADIQREPGVNKALTMFYSFFSLLYNVQAEALGNTKRARDLPQLAARVFILLSLPAYAEALMRNEWPDEDEDEDLLTFLALKPLFYSMGAVPFLRDMVGMAEGFGYSVSPLDSLGESLGRSVRGTVKAIDEGEVDAATAKATLSAIGFAAGVPVTQVNRIIDAADAMHEGEDVSPYDFLIGHKDK